MYITDNKKCIKKLLVNKYNIKKYNICDLFKLDRNRFKNFSYFINDILFDFSKQYINKKTVELLILLAKNKNILEKINILFEGKKVNYSQNKPSFHTHIRNFTYLNKNEKNRHVLKKMQIISDLLNQGKYITEDNEVIKDVISIGIGGSHLGSILCISSIFYKIKNKKCNIHFISGLDSKNILNILMNLSPRHTLCIISSKSFKTLETIENANIIRKWLKKSNLKYKNHLFAITSNKKNALSYGLKENNIFYFDCNIGGRYSICSSIGFIICISIGYKNFLQLLRGANIMDDHFKNEDLVNNIPFIMGAIGFWNVNINNYNIQTIIPYSNGLSYITNYFQQLEMESNGKTVNRENNLVNYKTVPLLWGGVGTNSQHTFMQFLHQSNEISPIDFILPLKNYYYSSSLDKLNIFNCLSQSETLMHGKKNLDDNYYCPGNKPSTTIILNDINPSTIGSLISTYEHKVYIQSLFWDINAFDQFGVELGKNSFKKNQQFFKNKKEFKIDSSTHNLVNYISKYYK